MRPMTRRPILVVEDEEKIARLLCDYLKAAGFRTSTQNRGDRVVSQIKKDPPDLWRRYLQAVRQQATFLARAGRLQIVRGGKVQDPNDFKGLVKLRLPRDSELEG